MTSRLTLARNRARGERAEAVEADQRQRRSGLRQALAALLAGALVLGASGRASLLEDQPPGLALLSAALTLVVMLLISWRVKRILQTKGIDAERLR